MTPAYLNSPPSPFPFIDHHHQIPVFSTTPVLPHDDQASSSLSSPIFFNTSQDHHQIASDHLGVPQKDNKYILHGGSSAQGLPSSSIHPPVDSTTGGHGFSICKIEGGGENEKEHHESPQWMSSKMRLMRKMINRGSDKLEREKCEGNSPSNGNNFIRTCSDCKTSKTPLWRSGPQGPKSLCNACGIRQRKARRAAMIAAAAAENGKVPETDCSTRTLYKGQKKETKSRPSYMAHFKKPFGSSDQGRGERISFEDFALGLSKSLAFQRAFPKDEEEAAILLMALSCGLLHS